MSVRQGLLAVLAEEPTYGSKLRAEFERRTGGTWPLNIGQVYQSLTRFQRDGLAEEVARQDDGTIVYAVTAHGRATLEAWWASPVDRGEPSRDELAIKLALAVTAPDVDVRAVVQRQRGESVRSLLSYTRLKQQVPEPPTRADVAWLLVLDSLTFAAEAEVRWLDHIEQRLATLENAPDDAPGGDPGDHPGDHQDDHQDDDRRGTRERAGR